MDSSRYNLILMTESEFKDSVCDICAFQGCCSTWVFHDCTTVIHNRFIDIFYRSEFNVGVLRGLI